jgi:hypothetical protein
MEDGSEQRYSAIDLARVIPPFGQLMRRRIILAIGVLSIGAITLAALTGWRGIAAGYHAWLLARDDALFEEYLDAEEGSIEEKGLRRYLRSEAGRKRLMEAYVDALSAELVDHSV